MELLDGHILIMFASYLLNIFDDYLFIVSV